MVTYHNCVDCDCLVSVGCDNKAQTYCTYFKQIISRPNITSCARPIEEERNDGRRDKKMD
jgi:hypothetical protein